MAEMLGIRPWEQALLTYRDWLLCKSYIDSKIKAQNSLQDNEID